MAENRYLDVKKEFKTTLGELCYKYHENFKEQASYKTAKYYFIKNIKKYFGNNALLANINYVHLETYQNTLRQTPTKRGGVRTNAAVNRQMACLRHLFTKGVEWDMIEQSPFDRGKSLALKENNVRLRFLSREEIARLLDACNPAVRHFVIFCIHTGARKQEAINLKWHQIKNGYVYFEKTKTDNPRQVPIDKDLQELLDKLRPKARRNVVSLSGQPVEGSKSDYVLLNNGKPYNSVTLHDAFKSACKRADIPYGIKTPDGVTVHTLRHTFGSWLAIKGICYSCNSEADGTQNHIHDHALCPLK